MPETLSVVKSFLNEDFLSQENIDRADEGVFEVFARMLGLAVMVVHHLSPPSARRRTYRDRRLFRRHARLL